MNAHAENNVTPATSQRDLLWVAAGTLLFWGVSMVFELNEHLAELVEPWERYQLDELPGVLLFLGCALAWYAWRRVRETREQLRLRLAAEAKLAATLAENRRLSLSHVEVQEAERKQLARELHDELGQHLNALKIDAVALRNWTEGQSEDMHGAALAIVDSANHVQDSLRDVLRRLRPAGLDELGLSAALEHLADHWRSRNSATSVTLDIGGDIDHLAEKENITCYRLVQEALNNVTRHARATRVSIRVARGVDGVELVVCDDGVGALNESAAPGLGLVGMRERVEALGGRIEITSPSGRGFEIRAGFPVGGEMP